MATSQEKLKFLALLNEALPNFDLPTAYQIRNLTLNKITELEQSIIDERVKFRKETLEKAAELGMEVSELLPVKEKVKAPPKYQDPNDPTKTWSGKGKVPNWIKSALEAGTELDALLIPTTTPDPEVGF